MPRIHVQNAFGETAGALLYHTAWTAEEHSNSLLRLHARIGAAIMLGRVGQRLSSQLGLMPCCSTALEGSQRTFAGFAGKGALSQRHALTIVVFLPEHKPMCLRGICTDARAGLQR